MEKSSGARRRWALAALVLFVLPLALRLFAIDHGAPRNYLPDTHVVRAALGMARDRDPVPPVRKYSSYPNLVPYALLPVYAGQYAVGRITGRWVSADEFGAAAMERPATVHVPARVVIALLGALTAWVVFRAARESGLGRGAWIAAWLVGVGGLHLHFSVQERPWVPMVLGMAACAWAAARYERTGGTRALLAAALTAALAFASHQAGAVACFLVAFAWAFGPLGWRGEDLRRRLVQGVASAALFVVVALVVGHPYLLVHGATPEGGVIGGAQEGSIAFGGQQFFYRFRLASAPRMALAFFGYDPLVLLLLLPGMVIAARTRGLRALTLFLAGWAFLFGTNYNDHVRYLLPLAALGAIPAGAAAERLLTTRAAVLACAPLLALPLVQGLRLDALLVRPDTRAEAEERLETLPPDAVVAIDRYGPQVPLSRPALERLAEFRARAGGVLYRRELHRLERLEQGATDGGVDAVPLEDLFYSGTREGDYLVRPGLEEYGSDPAAVLATLGVTHVLIVSRTPADLTMHPLLLALGLGREARRWEIDPTRGDGEAREARLPTELDFALRDLWAVERPGPWVGLYAIPR